MEKNSNVKRQKKFIYNQIVAKFVFCLYCHNPTLRECEDEIHTPKVGTWESFGTPKISEFDRRGQNTSHWGVLYIIRKLSKCRCRKWACMGIWTSATQVMAKRRVGSQTSSLTPDH